MTAPVCPVCGAFQGAFGTGDAVAPGRACRCLKGLAWAPKLAIAPVDGRGTEDVNKLGQYRPQGELPVEEVEIRFLPEY
jgi:hypothetical protein